MRLRPIACAVVLSFFASRASAQTAADTAAARELFVEAARLAGDGDWKSAEQKYARSLALKRSAVTLYSLGVAQRKSGHLVEALETFRAFLLEPVTASSGGYVDPVKAAIAELDPKIPRFVIDVAAGVPDVEVTLDGAPIPSAALGLPRLVNPGAHVVVAKAKGRAATRVERTATEGATETVHVELGAVDAPVDAPLAPRAVDTSSVEAPPGALAPLPPPSRVVPFTLIGAGAAVAGAGLALGLSGVSQALSVTRSDAPQASSARTRAAVGDVMVGAGVVAAAVGVGLLIFRHDPEPAKVARRTR